MIHPQRMQRGESKARRVLSIWRVSDPLLLQRMRYTRKPCSCPMCGNPRRWFGERTRQEQMADLAFQEQSSEEL